MLVLTDSETATGFRLAGVEVLESDQEGAQEALEGVIEGQDYGPRGGGSRADRRAQRGGG